MESIMTSKMVWVWGGKRGWHVDEDYSEATESRPAGSETEAVESWRPVDDARESDVAVAGMVEAR
jgi:hypothetical protein